MRLRFIMTIVFCLTALAPMLVFWLWPNSAIMQAELDDVRERHLVVARSISAELQRRMEGVLEGFPSIAREAVLLEDYIPDPYVIQTMNIKSICVADAASGVVGKNIPGGRGSCPKAFDPQELMQLKKQIKSANGKTAILPVVTDSRGINVVHLAFQNNENIVVGIMPVSFVAEIGDHVRFGEMGHVAIVDNSGRILSHPNRQWQDERHDMRDNPVVGEVISRKSGVGDYYSEQFGEEMVVGYAPVPATGWGIIVEQPYSELVSKVQDMKSAILLAMSVGLLIAIILALIATKLLTFPIVQMVQAMARIGNGELRAYERIKEGRFQPYEFRKARDAIKRMAEKLRENIDTISQHAYLDGITGLPNRECFKVLAQEEIERLGIAGQMGALLFLDLDGFKQVNDVYGHRSGDDLLKGFANKIHLYCGNEMKRRASGADNAVTILPARLGGDEFVIFLSNIRHVETVTEFANGLFQRVFGAFQLHNGVTLDVNGSVGGAIFPHHASDFDELLRVADIAMYKAKNSGKGKFCLHQDVDDFSASEARLEYEAEPGFAG